MTNAPAHPDRRRLRGQERRTAILTAACAVVARAGAGALTHRAVAAEAAVSLASTTYHFPSSHALRSAAFAHAGGHIAAEVTRLSAGIGEPRQLGAVAGEFAERLCRERRVETVAVLELIVAAGYDARLRRLARYFHRHLAAVIAPFLARPGDAPEVAAAMHGLVLVALTSAGPARSKGAEFARSATTTLIARYQSAPR